tara:strand:- start:940 stop:1281 length:342 start_codon:yes stop_codon:yes gene_type:complete
METVQTIFSRIKSADNSLLWAFAQELHSANKKVKTLEDKCKKINSNAVNLNDKERLRQDVLEHLYKESSKGNAQASDKLARIAGLGEQEQDIVIEIVNYNPKKKVGKKLPSKK